MLFLKEMALYIAICACLIGLAFAQSVSRITPSPEIGMIDGNLYLKWNYVTGNDTMQSIQWRYKNTETVLTYTPTFPNPEVQGPDFINRTSFSTNDGANAGLIIDNLQDTDASVYTIQVVFGVSGIKVGPDLSVVLIALTDMAPTVSFGNVVNANATVLSTLENVELTSSLTFSADFTHLRNKFFAERAEVTFEGTGFSVNGVCTFVETHACTAPLTINNIDDTENNKIFKILVRYGQIDENYSCRVTIKELTGDVALRYCVPGPIIIFIITVVVICCVYFLVVKKALDEIPCGGDNGKTIIKEAKKRMWLILGLAGILAIVIVVAVILAVYFVKDAPTDQTVILAVTLVFGIAGIIAIVIFGCIMHMTKLKITEDPPTKRDLHTPTSATSASAVNASINQKEGGHKPAYNYDADRKYLQTPDRSRRHGHLEPVTGVPQKEVDSPRRLPKPNSVSPEP